jgi:hypothetical protein
MTMPMPNGHRPDKKRTIGMRELSMIELNGTKGLATYSKAGRDLCRDIAQELDWAAHEVQASLARMHGHPLLMNIKVRFHARRVAARLRRARDLQIGSGIEMVKFWQEYRSRFGPAISPPKNPPKRQRWDFEG